MHEKREKLHATSQRSNISPEHTHLTMNSWSRAISMKRARPTQQCFENNKADQVNDSSTRFQLL